MQMAGHSIPAMSVHPTILIPLVVFTHVFLFPSPRLGKDAPEGLDDAEGGTISISQILSLKERFDSADTDGGGSLDLQEFMDAFGSIINKDGSMSGVQFLSFCFSLFLVNCSRT
jgi:hypothetical protein